MSEIIELEKQDRWLHYVANALLPWFHQDHDDLVQEGWIAMWLAVDSYKPGTRPLDKWMRYAARKRMLDIAYNDKPHFGTEADRTRWKVPERTSLEEMLEASPETAIALKDTLDGVEIAYHEGEIIQAINSLTPDQRFHVVLRFWGGIEPLKPGEKRPTKREDRVHFQARKEVIENLAPEFSSKDVHEVWDNAKAELETYLDHMRTGYGD